MAPRWIVEEQERLTQVAEQDHIRQLRQKVDTAKAELSEALLQRENRIMTEE